MSIPEVTLMKMVMAIIKPVSYTHLDVYKRQVISLEQLLGPVCLETRS